MTTAVDLPPHIASLNPDARFNRVPSPHGDGVLLVADAAGGVVAIAPPWTWLDIRGEEPTSTAWRYGWFPPAEDGYADLDAAALEGGELPFNAIWHLRQLKPHRRFLKACVVGCAEQLGVLAGFGDREVRDPATERLQKVRAEWAQTFPDEPFPTPVAPVVAPPALRRSLIDLMQAGLRRAFAVDWSNEQAAFASLEEPGVEEGREEAQAVGTGRSYLSFGENVQVRLPAEPGQQAELVINFDQLARQERKVAELSGSPVKIALVDPSDNTVLASVDIDAAAGCRREPLDIDVEHLPKAIRLVFLN